MSSIVSTTLQTSILNDLLYKRYAYIQSDYYLYKTMNKEENDLKQVQSTYNKLSKDPSLRNRYRAYMKLNWCEAKQTYIKNTNNDYFQAKEFNYTDGGKIRKFDIIDDFFINSTLIQSVLVRDIDIARKTNMFKFDSNLEIGLHQIRYQPTRDEPAYSSPKWLHKDDESLVFLHLLNITNKLTGGDSLFACDKETISNIIRLNSPLETLLFNQKIYHAVTPMNCLNGDTGYSDILLVTFQEKKSEKDSEQGQK